MIFLGGGFGDGFDCFWLVLLLGLSLQSGLLIFVKS